MLETAVAALAWDSSPRRRAGAIRRGEEGRDGRAADVARGGGRNHGRGDPVAGRRAARADDDGREGRAAHAILLLRVARGVGGAADRRRCDVAGGDGRGGARPGRGGVAGLSPPPRADPTPPPAPRGGAPGPRPPAP